MRARMIKPKESGIIVSGVALLLLFMGLMTEGLSFYLVSAAVLCFVLIDFYGQFFSIRDLRKNMRIGSGLKRKIFFLGSPIRLESSIQYFGKHNYKVKVLNPDMEVEIKPGNPVVLTSEYKPLASGMFVIPSPRFTFESKFFKDVILLGNPEEVIIHYPLGGKDIQNNAIRGDAKKRLSDIFYSTIIKRGEGVDFSNVRDYCQGDVVKNIDWVRSRNSGKIIIREYEEEYMRPVLFFIDVDASMGAGKPVTELESALGLTASLFNKFILKNESAGIICFSRSDITYYLPPGIGKGHIVAARDALSNIKPVEVSHLPRKSNTTLNEAGEMKRMFMGLGGGEVLGSVIDETLKGYRRNVDEDGFMKAIDKVSDASDKRLNIVVLTNLSMGMRSLLNGIKAARYYGHTVSVVLMPHIWFEDMDEPDYDRYYTKYMEVKENVAKIYAHGDVKVIDMSASQTPDDIIYGGRVKDRIKTMSR